MTNPLLAAKALGQQVWLDNLSRDLLRDGSLSRMISQDGIDGVTSNPAIFQKALANSAHYHDDLQRLRATTLTAEERYEQLAVPDIRAACDLLYPVFQRSGGDAGYVSLEVSPELAHDEAGTHKAAHRLRNEVGCSNLLIKIPATPAGIRAFERLTSEGVNVNVTLMFSLRHMEAVAQAYLRGARSWLQVGGDPRHLKSVASIFLSRVDTAVDQKLEALGGGAQELCGKAALAMAKRCYRRYAELFHGPAFADLAARGVRPQHLLWASTGTKNPAYSDLLYVEPLIGPDTVNTMPDATLAAFRDHGRVAATAMAGLDEADRVVNALASLGIDLDEVGENLQADGLRLFVDAFAAMLAGVA